MCWKFSTRAALRNAIALGCPNSKTWVPRNMSVLVQSLGKMCDVLSMEGSEDVFFLHGKMKNVWHFGWELFSFFRFFVESPLRGPRRLLMGISHLFLLLLLEVDIIARWT